MKTKNSAKRTPKRHKISRRFESGSNYSNHLVIDFFKQ